MLAGGARDFVHGIMGLGDCIQFILTVSSSLLLSVSSLSFNSIIFSFFLSTFLFYFSIIHSPLFPSTLLWFSPFPLSPLLPFLFPFYFLHLLFFLFPPFPLHSPLPSPPLPLPLSPLPLPFPRLPSPFASFSSSLPLFFPFLKNHSTDPNVGTHSPPPTCAPPLDNYLNYSGSCYKLVSTPTSWQDAEDACVSEGAHLASVQHVSEQSFLWVLALDTGVEDMWIGLNNLKDKVQYRWSDDWPTIYTNWAKNEPNTNQTDYNCVRLSAIKDGSWYSELCTEKRPYVCKHKDGRLQAQGRETMKLIKFEEELSRAPPDPPATGRCPDDRWLNLGGGFCYLVVESAKPWNDASMK
ncbi:putative macrophage mannose receptor 1-like [Penaeus vannamei]|uniref:Putative macrophage mannose receptor 1-like n=1 Tax=Penaeus vannamei TaxID=6689 RepID=A0A423SHW6_PENVA|nr:putative macrophage mannose receptor 1-like [Penaeus vannamei]